MKSILSNISLGSKKLLAVAVLLSALGTPSFGADFVRGDANGDLAVNIADTIYMLTYLTGESTSTCLDSMDVDDNGEVDIIDPIVHLAHLFEGRSIPEPLGLCGVDPTVDPLDCLSSVCP